MSPKSGIYLFSEGNHHLYVGRSNNLRNRLGQHWREGSKHNQAVFAFKIAREATDNIDPSYTTGPKSRVGLENDPAFKEAFKNAKERLHSMDVRFVEMNDQKQQTLLEIYCAISLATPYNSFGTH